MQLDENQLWVLVHIDRQQPQRYYLKCFNDGAMEGSGPYEFVRQLLEKYPQGGNVQVSLLKKADSIPKLIGHLNMIPSLRELFFRKSRGTHINFKGAKIAIDRDEKCRLLLQELSVAYRRSDDQENADH